jgi:outer membrane lipoprotein-sorting protein
MSRLKLVVLIFLLSYAKTSASVAEFTENPAFKELNAFLESIKTAKGEFEQTFQNKKARGNFAIEMPGKFKLEYYGNVIPISMVVNNEVFIYYDRELDQKTQLSTPKTIASLFLRKNLSLLDSDIKVLSFKHQMEGYIVEFEKKSSPKEGKFVAYLRKNPDITLEKLEIISPEGINTLKFSNIVLNSSLPKGTFMIKDQKKIDAKINY